MGTKWVASVVVAVVVIAAVVLLARSGTFWERSAPLTEPTVPDAPVAPADMTEVLVRISAAGFTPSTVEIQADKVVHLTLRNTGQRTQGMLVPDLDLRLAVEPRTEVKTTLAGITPGSYPFYDPYSRQFEGELVVTN